MRKVLLTMNELQKYNTIKKLVETNGNKHAAAHKIGCSTRHLYRLINGYHEQGKIFFSHGNKGRLPKHTISTDLKNTILSLYREKYFHCNFTHFKELLLLFEGIQLSTTSISSILRTEFILSPKATRKSKKTLNAELKALKLSTPSKKKTTLIQKAILDLQDAHPRRPRCPYFGEMLQMDASQHLWFGDSITHLHIAVDDATGAIVGAHFDTQETLQGYYHVFQQILLNHGIPYQFFTDNRTVFEYKLKKQTTVEKDTFTQFGYACKQLGVELNTSSVPQAKGRVERMFNTLQSRLPVELRLANVTSIEQANQFLLSYIKKFNDKFALPINRIKSVFEMQPSIEKINLILSVLSTRKIDNGSCLKYQNQYYLPWTVKDYLSIIRKEQM